MRLSDLTFLLALILASALCANAAAAPSAAFDHSPDRVIVGEEVTFNASASTGENLTYHWDFGDGESGTGKIVRHTYRHTGNYTVVLVVTNASGAMDIATETVEVGAEGDLLDLLFFMFMFLIYVIFYVVFIAIYVVAVMALAVVIPLLIGILMVVNIVLGAFLGYRAYAGAKDAERKDLAIPYIIAHAAAVVIGLYVVIMLPQSLAAHGFIHWKFKKAMEADSADEKGFEKEKAVDDEKLH